MKAEILLELLAGIAECLHLPATKFPWWAILVLSIVAVGLAVGFLIATSAR